uniref:AP2/ERF domain-containing protein n=1 Tax=Oryza barthii TaxID=65489 RepID=A0A0D3FKL4_9ORYZ
MAAGLGPGQRWRTTQVGQPEEAHRHVVEAGVAAAEEEVAEAYNIAVITFRGLNAITNFDMSCYDVKSILDSPVIPVGNGAK